MRERDIIVKEDKEIGRLLRKEIYKKFGTQKKLVEKILELELSAFKVSTLNKNLSYCVGGDASISTFYKTNKNGNKKDITFLNMVCNLLDLSAGSELVRRIRATNPEEFDKYSSHYSFVYIDNIKKY